MRQSINSYTPLRKSHWKTPETTGAALLPALGIEKERLNRHPAELSGGEMQRFCIARALSHQTQFIIADEISTMLDVITQAQVWDLLLKGLQERDIGMIAITRSPESAERICTRVIRFDEINKGEKQRSFEESGTKEKKHARLEKGTLLVLLGGASL